MCQQKSHSGILVFPAKTTGLCWSQLLGYWYIIRLALFLKENSIAFIHRPLFLTFLTVQYSHKILLNQYVFVYYNISEHIFSQYRAKMKILFGRILNHVWASCLTWNTVSSSKNIFDDLKAHEVKTVQLTSLGSKASMVYLEVIHTPFALVAIIKMNVSKVWHVLGVTAAAFRGAPSRCLCELYMISLPEPWGTAGNFFIFVAF